MPFPYSRLARWMLIFFLALTILGVVFQFTLAAGCLLPDAAHTGRCPTDRQSQILPAGSIEPLPLLYLILPAVPAIAAISALFYPLETGVCQKPFLLAQDIAHPPTGLYRQA